MNYRTQDVIVWDRLPHPDSRTPSATWSVRVTPPFWQRLAVHVRVPARRGVWAQWLTPAAVDALCDADDARQPAPATAARGRARSVASSAAEAPAVPMAAIHRLQETLAASLGRPNVLRIDGPDATRYHVVLVNGASLILRAVPGKRDLLDLEDCFFSRAAWDCLDAAGRDDTNGRRTGGANRGTHESWRGLSADAANRSALYLSAAPFAADSSADESHTASTAPGVFVSYAASDSPACRRAVVRQLVQRYAVTDEPAGGLVPPGDEAVRESADESVFRVRFLAPGAWGFAGPEVGRRWTGCDDDCDASANGSAEAMAFGLAVHRLFMGNDASRSRPTSDPAPRVAARWGAMAPYPSDLYTATGNSTGPSGNPANFPRPDDASQPARPAPPAACPFLDPLGCLKDLNDAFRRLDPRALRGDMTSSNDERVRATAYRATAALGKCRVFGATAAGLTDAVLAPAVAIAAAAELDKRMRRLTSEAESLPALLARAGAAAGEDACLGLLEARTEAWAAYVAIDESYTAALESGDDPSGAFSDVIDRLFGAAEALDAAMQAAEARWSIPAAERLLSNWRTLLSEPYRESPPWWLQPACLAVDATASAL